MLPRLRVRRTVRTTQTVVLSCALLASTALATMASASQAPLYKDPHASVTARVNDLLARMSGHVLCSLHLAASNYVRVRPSPKCAPATHRDCHRGPK